MRLLVDTPEQLVECRIGLDYDRRALQLTVVHHDVDLVATIRPLARPRGSWVLWLRCGPESAEVLENIELDCFQVLPYFLQLLISLTDPVYEVADAVAWERWEGTIEYTFMAPVYRLTHLAGQCVYAIVYGFLRSGIVLVSAVMFFDLSLAGGNLVTATVVLAASSLSFLGMGLIAAVFPLLSPEKGARATDILGTLFLLISGVYYDVSVLPDWLRPLSTVSPGTYALRSIRAALLNGATVGEVSGDLWILLLTGIIMIPLGLWVFHVAEVYAKKTGRLKRSG